MMSVDVLTAAVVVAAVASVAWSTVVPIAIALRRGGRQDSPSADGPALSVSRFTIPVSIVVPIDAESASACRVIANLLALSYPELEVIVVADGLPPQDVRALATTWCLKPSEFFYRRVLDTCDVRRIFRGRDDRLIIVEKAAGGHADAVNCGVNFARFRYIAVVKPEVNCEPDALLRSMAPALRDPGHVLAVVTHVERRLQVRLKPDPTYGSHQAQNSTWGPASAGPGLLPVFQQIDSIRAFMESRVRSLEQRRGPCSHEAVVIWRRDAFQAAGGLKAANPAKAGSHVGPEYDLMRRLTTAGSERRSYVLRVPEIFGFTTPREPVDLAGDSGPRPSARGVSFVQLTMLGAAIIGAAGGWVGILPLVLMLLLMVFGRAAVTAAALLVRGSSPGAPDTNEIKRLLWASPLEPLLRAWSDVSAAWRRATQRYSLKGI
jgi:hypothetical protein